MGSAGHFSSGGGDGVSEGFSVVPPNDSAIGGVVMSAVAMVATDPLLFCVTMRSPFAPEAHVIYFARKCGTFSTGLAQDCLQSQD